MASLYATFVDIEVAYEPALNGGGTAFGQQFLTAVRDHVGPVDHSFEFCAGPGFIGFSLLANQLCRRLTLADINPAAVAACQETIERNHLENVCSALVSDCFESIPSSQRWDLIVGNLPHWPTPAEGKRPSLLRDDLGLQIHRRFFHEAGSRLSSNGSILLQENGLATSPEAFSGMIADGGLTLIDTFRVDAESAFYFLWCKQR